MVFKMIKDIVKGANLILLNQIVIFFYKKKKKGGSGIAPQCQYLNPSLLGWYKGFSLIESNPE